MQNIIFINSNDVPEEFAPQPASKLIPQWYKDTESYINGKKMPMGKANISSTIKRCMPVFDALNFGYILVTHTDIYISRKEQADSEGNIKNMAWYEWPSYNALEFHSIEQALNHPKIKENNGVPKWMNPWGIKTPKGYSTLFISPMHHDNKIIILPGVVDTDKYDIPVNFVFSFADPNFEGIIPAGTPIVQVIPFKRDKWKMNIGKNKDFKIMSNNLKKLRTRFFDAYKNIYRENKEYK